MLGNPRYAWMREIAIRATQNYARYHSYRWINVNSRDIMAERRPNGINYVDARVNKCHALRKLL